VQLHSKFQKEIFRPWILASFFWLILIVLLGVTMRISLVMGIQLPTSFSFARHAHSHTAFWGWAGPAMFGFILATCVDDINRNPK
jgi:cbb3-type cytochrome oxidase subunit 1